MTTPASLAEAVVKGSVDGLAVIDRETRYTLWNPAMERFTGKSAAEVLGRKAFDVFPFLRELGLDATIERVLAGNAITTEGLPYLEPDGTRRVYDRLYLPLREASGEISGVIAIIRDATTRHTALEDLRTAQAKLLMAAEAGGIGLWTWDPEADAITWEDTMCALYGRAAGEVPRGRDEYVALIHPDDRQASLDRIARGRAVGHWEHEYRIVRPDGALRWLASRTRLVQAERGEMVLGAVFDVTERREREERQRATQRLEAVGELAAGIAHNFNNLLMGILPTLELAARKAPPNLLPLLQIAQDSAQRAASVVRQLTTYASRNHSRSRRCEPIGPLVERVAGFCRTTLDARITLDVRCADSSAALVDMTQIEQAVLNLLINARDALDDGAIAAPQITVSVEAVIAGAAELEGRPGDWVVVRVLDNGVGMARATIQRIYEPFFTTKPVGKGTGLGLATTHAIVRDHEGFLACASTLGRGTAFSLYLPRALTSRAVVEGRRVVRSSPSPALGPATILVVDDDDAVRRVVRRMLESDGFRVETASSGDEALARMSDPARAQGIDLVVLDVSMPGTPGPETRRRLAGIAPELPVVFLTGHAFEPESGDPVLTKPVTEAALAACIREMLARRSAT